MYISLSQVLLEDDCSMSAYSEDDYSGLNNWELEIIKLAVQCSAPRIQSVLADVLHARKKKFNYIFLIN